MSDRKFYHGVDPDPNTRAAIYWFSHVTPRGTVYHRALWRVFPGRRKNTKAIPQRYIR